MQWPYILRKLLSNIFYCIANLRASIDSSKWPLHSYNYGNNLKIGNLSIDFLTWDPVSQLKKYQLVSIHRIYVRLMQRYIVIDLWAACNNVFFSVIHYSHCLHWFLKSVNWEHLHLGTKPNPGTISVLPNPFQKIYHTLHVR